MGTPLSANAAAPSGASPQAARTYQVGLFGDMPYGVYGRAQYPAVLRDINGANLAFSLFDGDIKNGSEPCYANFDGSALGGRPTRRLRAHPTDAGPACSAPAT